MQKPTLSAVAKLAVLLWVFALPFLSDAQSKSQMIPTAPQVAMQKKVDPKSHKGLMRGTTANERWQAAIQHADRRAAKIRSTHKGVKQP